MYSLALRQLPFPVVASPRIIYTYIYSCVSPFALQQSWYLMLIPVATRSVFLHMNIRTFIYIYYIYGPPLLIF